MIFLYFGLFVLLGYLTDGAIVPVNSLYVGFNPHDCRSSINDTIVVFDRIREELDLNAQPKKIILIAINRVLSRSILTSFTTLLAAVSLWIFGAGIISFAFVFVIGILTGTFSSIFISPIFFFWHKGDRKHVEDNDILPKYDWQTSVQNKYLFSKLVLSHNALDRRAILS